jgi:NAD-dependent deacetylase
MPSLEETVSSIARMLRTYRYPVVFTGAGMSTESGIPDFRGSGGLWEGRDPKEVASASALKKNPKELALFYKGRIQENLSNKPNKSHYILNEWLFNGTIRHIATQNVDGYHMVNPEVSNRISELHGNLTLYCTQCGDKYPKEKYLEDDNTFCVCDQCKGFVRPDITLFGETLPSEAFTKARKAFKKSTLCLVLGTSGEVYPANSLPNLVFERGGRVVIINKTETELDHLAIHKINNVNLSVALDAINKELLSK